MEVHGLGELPERLSGQTLFDRLDAGREKVLVSVGQFITCKGDLAEIGQGDRLLALLADHELALDRVGQLEPLLVGGHLIAFGRVEELEAALVLLALRLAPLVEQQLTDRLLVHHVLVTTICN